MSAPVLDSLKAVDTRLQETKSQDRNAHSKSKDDNPEKKKAPDLESVDRFDRENLFCGFNGYNLWDSFNQRTNTLNNTTMKFGRFILFVLHLFFEKVCFCLLLSLFYTPDVGIHSFFF